MTRILLAALLACSTHLPARERLLNDPIFLVDLQAQRLELGGQGSYYSIDELSTRLETASGISYGLNESLHFTFSIPWYSEAFDQESKAGQGDFAASLTWHRPWFGSERWRWGLRETLRFPTGYREELEGFSSFTSGSTRSESLLLVELRERRFVIDGHLGFSLDDRREEVRNIWGIGLRQELIGEWLMMEMEIGQELDLKNKDYDYQFYAGARSRLPFGITLKFGAEHRLFDGEDSFGVYGGLGWHFQPSIPVRVTHRHLRESMRATLERKNSTPSLSLEPGFGGAGDESAMNLPRQLIRVAVLPFADTGGHPVSQDLWERCLEHFESDSSLSVVPARDLERAMIEEGVRDRIPNEQEALRIADRLLADFVVSGRILDSEPAERSGLDLSPLLSRTHFESRLSALVNLVQVGDGRVLFKGRIGSSARSEASTTLFHARAHHRDTLFRATHRQRLLEKTLDDWAGRALDELFYEYSEQLVVK